MTRLKIYRRGFVALVVATVLGVLAILVADALVAPAALALDDAVYECIFLLEDDDGDCGRVCGAVPRIRECTRRGPDAAELLLSGDGGSSYVVEVSNLIDDPYFEVVERRGEPWLTAAARIVGVALELVIFMFPVYVLSLMLFVRLPGSSDLRESPDLTGDAHADLVAKVVALGFEETIRRMTSDGHFVHFRHKTFETEAMVYRMRGGALSVEYVDNYEGRRAVLSNNVHITPGIFVLRKGVTVHWFPHLKDPARLFEVHRRLGLDEVHETPGDPETTIAEELAESFELQIKAGFMRPHIDKLRLTFGGSIRYAALLAPPFGWIRSLYRRGAARCFEYDVMRSSQSRADQA